MTVFKPNHKDIKSLLLIRVPFMVLLCYVLFSRAYFSSVKIFVPATAVAVLFTIVTWYLQMYADRSIRGRKTDSNRIVKHIIITLLFHFIISSVFISILFLWTDAVHFLGYRFTWGNYLSGLTVVFFANLTAIGFQEGVHIFESWKRTLIEAEELKKLTLKNRLAGLRNQTSPHFFFNNINTLSGLIDVDTEKAERFLDEMCVVYRYLLRNETDSFAPLYKELNFIRSWIYIMQTRYGSSLQFSIKGDESDHSICISRLTLLTLLENILDTHIIDKKASFQIIIDIKSDKVEISHTFSKKKSPERIKKKENIKIDLSRTSSTIPLFKVPDRKTPAFHQ